ncbi:unnamed protein product, partial [Orchesella dallaii]
AVCKDLQEWSSQLSEGILTPKSKRKLQDAFLSKVYAHFQTYRQIYNCWDLFTRFHSSILVQCVLSLSAAQVCTTCYLVLFTRGTLQIEKGNGIIWMLLAVLFVLNFTMALICIMSAAANVQSAYKDAVNSIKIQQTGISIMGYKIVSRMIKAQPQVKTKFGISNYVDRLTPIFVQDFNVKRMVDLLLVQK